VYCEIQGEESSGVILRNLLTNLYPGKCGYKSETSGIMKNLRDSTTNKKVIIVYLKILKTHLKIKI